MSTKLTLHYDHATQADRMFNIDLKTLGELESHRGLGYITFAAALFAPSFLAYGLATPSGIQHPLLFSVLFAASLGLLATAFAATFAFAALSVPYGGKMKARAGAMALGLGSASSLVVQTLALGLLLIQQGPWSFLKYAQWTLILTGVLLLGFMALSEFYERQERKRREAAARELTNVEASLTKAEIDARNRSVKPEELTIRLRVLRVRVAALNAEIRSLAKL